MAQVEHITAKVTGIAQTDRTARLRFEGGTMETFSARDELDRTEGKVGDRAVFRAAPFLVSRWDC